MIANHIHDALGQVRRLQELVLDKSLFKGYSGKARIVCGAIALAGAAVMASPRMPPTQWAHLTGWMTVALVGVVLNYVSLLYWFVFDKQVRRNPIMLKPALDAVPALGVGAILTVALAAAGQYDLLFGIWMALYGLAQVAYRKSLPGGIYMIGVGYVVCGCWCLMSSRISFLDPWPMGIVFFAGELAGGIILLVNKMSDVHEVHR